MSDKTLSSASVGSLLHPARPEMSGDVRVEFGTVEADLRQDEQKPDKTDHKAVLAVGCRTVAELVLDESGFGGDEKRETKGREDRAGEEVLASSRDPVSPRETQSSRMQS